MDDLGADELSKLSMSEKKIKHQSPIDASPSATQTATLRAAFLAQKSDNSETPTKPTQIDTPRYRPKDRTILGGICSLTYPNHYSHQQQHMNEADEEEPSLASSSDGREKTDATPENTKKMDDVIDQPEQPFELLEKMANNSKLITKPIESETEPPNKKNEEIMTLNDEQPSLTTPNSTIADDDESSASSTAAKQQCLAFTIDFGNDSSKDSAAKYKSMVERFQNRHRRGASMSKLEGAEVAPSTPAPVEPPTPTAPAPSSPRVVPEVPPAETTTVKVRMRPRDRSTSRVKDATKRHSWSPRSSTTEPPVTNHNYVKPTPQKQTTATSTKKIKSKPANLNLGASSTHVVPPPRREKSTTSSGHKPFTPRSTAMQMALQKIDFMCPQPPLDDFHNNLAMNDNVSEAGTYTLDGDNYTEEQKDLMNIDKTTTSSDVSSSGNHHLHQRPKDLPLRNNIQASLQERRRNNVLEVNYYHETTTTPFKPPSAVPTSNKTSYLDKIKTRVRNITAKQEPLQIKETSPSDPDVGTFTSVTTSGVLAKKTTLDSHPKLTRRTSLSTSQIDSSEYVSTETKLKSNSGAAYNGGYTDHQKSGYRLNVFTTQTDAKVLSAIESPESPMTKHSETGGLKTAQSKNDWIQEWARNARARSVASVIKGSPVKQSPNNQQHYDIMSRSYNCGGGEGPDEQPALDENTIYRNKNIDRFRMGDFDYASDPNVSAQRLPKSPTKIPSPLHTIGRARSASHTRTSLQNIIQDDSNNTDLYLQKTAVAISNLQQTFSRRNSIKSPPSSRDSPKKLPNRHQYYSADEYSPQHSIEGKLVLANPHQNKRGTPGNNLMTNSYHEQLVLDVKIPRARKNSYDAQSQALTVSPARLRQPLLANNKQYYGIDQTRGVVVVEQSSIKQQQPQQQQLSPLRRSSSFSAKCRTTTSSIQLQQQKIANANNLYTPPTVRHNYVGPSGQHQKVVPTSSAIKKSASSTTFRHVYSDYDDNLAYYINDEDDLVDQEYYGSSDEDLHSDYEEYNDDLVLSEAVHGAEVPLTNTRYNKALLMRIERSKQKVAATSAAAAATLGVKSNLIGVAACPNTPELPRRNIKSAPRSSMRQSVPRDSSLNRLAGHIPNSLASAKKQILQTANIVSNANNAFGTNQSSSSSTDNTNALTKRVQPKYMDISKYKPAQGNNFLRKNDSKSTLKPEIRRSPSSASMGLSRTDVTRASNRSVKSATSARGTSVSSATWRDSSVSKQKEVELAMWKRRAKYDPMRAAAEDRKKKEEAKKTTTTTMMTTTTNATQGNNNGQAGSAVTERPSRSPYRRGEF